MKTAYTESTTESCFAVYRFGAACQAKWNQLKQQVSAELASSFGEILDDRRLSQVVNEADALAGSTPYPVLLFPTLAEEKVRAAVGWQQRQNELFARPLNVAMAA